MLAFIGMPGPIELLIILAICGVPVVAIAIVVYLVVTGARRSKSNLIPCPDCGHLVSPGAKSCPNCGVPF